jgi:hypothetical protein
MRLIAPAVSAVMASPLCSMVLINVMRLRPGRRRRVAAALDLAPCYAATGRHAGGAHA